VSRQFAGRKRILLVACWIGLGASLGQVASSFASSSSKIIYACVNRETGLMRYVSTGRCRSTERLLSWNLQGPSGARGEQGEQGLQGPRGASGEQPNTILTGSGAPNSSTGIVGDLYLDTATTKLFGPKSATGWPASVSLVGPAGPAGATGGTGPAGPAGSSAATAATNTIRSGAGAPSAAIGADGDFYIDTSANQIYGPKALGAWPSAVSLVGPAGSNGATGAAGSAGSTGATGSPGANGNSVLSGAGAPGAGVGSNGDFYINTSTNTIFGPKTAGAWGSGTSLIGPTGPTGAGAMSYISAVSVTRSGNSPSSYTTIYSSGSTVAVGLSCYTQLSDSSWVYALSAKAPSGSTITGGGHLLANPQNNFYGIAGTADGTLTRLTRGGTGPFESSNNEFYKISIFGPSISPVEVSIQIAQQSGSCVVSGYVQSAG